MPGVSEIAGKAFHSFSRLVTWVTSPLRGSHSSRDSNSRKRDRSDTAQDLPDAPQDMQGPMGKKVRCASASGEHLKSERADAAARNNVVRSASAGSLRGTLSRLRDEAHAALERQRQAEYLGYASPESSHGSHARSPSSPIYVLSPNSAFAAPGTRSETGQRGSPERVHHANSRADAARASRDTRPATSTVLERLGSRFNSLRVDSEYQRSRRAEIEELETSLSTAKLRRSSSFSNAPQELTELDERAALHASRLLESSVKAREADIVIDSDSDEDDGAASSADALQELIAHLKPLGPFFLSDRAVALPALHKTHREALDLLHRDYSVDEHAVLRSEYNVRVSRHHLRSLGEAEWLTSEMVDYYLALCNDSFEDAHVFSTFFYSALTRNNTYAFENVKRWTRRRRNVDLFAKRVVCFPVNIGNTHWICAIAYMEEKRLVLRDSLNGNHGLVLSHLAEYLRDEYEDRKGEPFPLELWTIEHDRDVPQQRNGYDCGVFMCQYVACACMGTSMIFSQRDMAKLRKVMTVEIMTASKSVLEQQLV